MNYHIPISNVIGKPKDVNWYMGPFVKELKPILENGLIINEKKISIKIRCWICDTPARCFLKGYSKILLFKIIYIINSILVIFLRRHCFEWIFWMFEM